MAGLQIQELATCVTLALCNATSADLTGLLLLLSLATLCGTTLIATTYLVCRCMAACAARRTSIVSGRPTTSRESDPQSPPADSTSSFALRSPATSQMSGGVSLGLMLELALEGLLLVLSCLSMATAAAFLFSQVTPLDSVRTLAHTMHRSFFGPQAHQALSASVAQCVQTGFVATAFTTCHTFVAESVLIMTEMLLESAMSFGRHPTTQAFFIALAALATLTALIASSVLAARACARLKKRLDEIGKQKAPVSVGSRPPTEPTTSPHEAFSPMMVGAGLVAALTAMRSAASSETSEMAIPGHDLMEPLALPKGIVMFGLYTTNDDGSYVDVVGSGVFIKPPPSANIPERERAQRTYLMTARHVWAVVEPRVQHSQARLIAAGLDWKQQRHTAIETDTVEVLVVADDFVLLGLPAHYQTRLGISAAKLGSLNALGSVSVYGPDIEHGKVLYSTGVVDKAPGMERYKHTASTLPGFSGSPLWCQGHVVGVHTGGKVDGQSKYNLACPAAYAMLYFISEHPLVGKGKPGAVVEEASDGHFSDPGSRSQPIRRTRRPIKGHLVYIKNEPRYKAMLNDRTVEYSDADDLEPSFYEEAAEQREFAFATNGAIAAALKKPSDVDPELERLRTQNEELRELVKAFTKSLETSTRTQSRIYAEAAEPATPAPAKAYPEIWGAVHTSRDENYRTHRPKQTALNEAEEKLMGEVYQEFGITDEERLSHPTRTCDAVYRSLDYQLRRTYKPDENDGLVVARIPFTNGLDNMLKSTSVYESESFLHEWVAKDGHDRSEEKLREWFNETMAAVNPDANPGYPWCKDYKTVASMMETVGAMDRLFARFRSAVQSILRGQVPPGDMGVVRLFAKNEPLPRKKVGVRERIIWNTSIERQLIVRLVFGEVIEQSKGRVHEPDVAPAIGIGLTAQAARDLTMAFTRLLNENRFVKTQGDDEVMLITIGKRKFIIDSDASGWDMSVHEEDRETIAKMYKTQMPWASVYIDTVLNWFAQSPVLMPDGNMFTISAPKAFIQKSGEFNTSENNSKLRAAYGYAFMDYVQKNVDLKKATDEACEQLKKEYVAFYKRYGKRIDPVNVVEIQRNMDKLEMEFCSTRFQFVVRNGTVRPTRRGVTPCNRHKHIFQYLTGAEKTREQAVASLRALYELADPQLQGRIEHYIAKCDKLRAGRKADVVGDEEEE